MAEYDVTDDDYAAARAAVKAKNANSEQTRAAKLGHFERHTGLMSAWVLGPGDFKHHPIGFVLVLWNLVLISWYLGRVINAETTSLYIGTIFTALVNGAVGLGAIIWLHWNVAQFNEHIDKVRSLDVSSGMFRRIQDNFLANMNSLYVAYSATVVSIVMTILYTLIYVRDDLVAQDTAATVYPIVAPIQFLHLIVMGADIATITTSVVIVIVALSAILSGITRSFDYRAATRGEPSSAPASILVGQLARAAPTLNSRVPLLGISTSTQ